MFMFANDDGVENAVIRCRYGTNLRTSASTSEVRISNQSFFQVLDKVGLQALIQGGVKHCSLKGEFKSTNTILGITDRLSIQ